MLQAGLAAPISRGNSNRPDNQSTHWFWYSDFPQIITELGARGVDSCYFKIRANDLQNDPTWNWPNPDTHKTSIAAGFFSISFYKKNLASSTCCLQSAPLQNTQLASSQTLWYPACIRHLTGSKVRTATASTFTLKRASLQLWSAASGLRLSRGKCEDRNRVWHLFKLKEWQSVKVQKLPSRNDFSQRPQGGKRLNYVCKEFQFGGFSSRHHDWRVSSTTQTKRASLTQRSTSLHVSLSVQVHLKSQ